MRVRKASHPPHKHSQEEMIVMKEGTVDFFINGKVTRAGPGTKVVCLGNISQIDTPYLTEGSSGLTYVVDRFKGWAHSGHVTLLRGERSRLADQAGEVL